MALLTGPHQTCFSEDGSLTIRLSDGERPVLAPEYADSAPEAVIAEPVSYTRASSYRAATPGLATCGADEFMPAYICTAWLVYERLKLGHIRCELSREAPPQARYAPAAAWTHISQQLSSPSNEMFHSLDAAGVQRGLVNSRPGHGD